MIRLMEVMRMKIDMIGILIATGRIAVTMIGIIKKKVISKTMFLLLHQTHQLTMVLINLHNPCNRLTN